MWRVRQFGNHWVVVKPNGVPITASGMGVPINAGGPLTHALTAAAENGDLHPFTREGYSAAVAQLVEEEATARGDALRAAIEYVDDTPSPGWVADAAYEGVWTGDRRFIEPDALTWREPPMALMYQDETEVGHFGAVLAGWIESTTREGNTIVQRGQYDDNEAGYELRGVVAARGRFGVSIDLGSADGTIECVEEDDDGWCMAWEERITNGEIIGLTATPFPAFADAHMRPDTPENEVADDEGDDAEDAAAMAAGATVTPIRAGGFPIAPPAAWMADPQFTDDHPRMEYSECAETSQLVPVGVPLTVEDSGQVYGHLFAWGTCHTGYPNECVTPPSSPTGYAYFRTGEVVTAAGTRVATGVITMGIGHADLHMNAQEAAAHYDNSRYGVADVVMGEDGYGGWFAGSLRPDVTPEQVRALRALSLSGDWRTLGGQLDLVAALAVNHPGFPILRNLAAAANVPESATAKVRALVASGRPMALVSAGCVPNRPPVGDTEGGAPTTAWAARIERQLGVLDRRTRPLVGLAAQQVRDRVAQHRH